MPYSQFVLSKAVQDFGLTLIEGGSFLTPVQSFPIASYLEEYLTKNLSLAIALNTEKARSELLICPLLLAVKETVKNVGFFSGEEFNVAPEIGLNGICDYILTKSSQQLFVTAPIAVIVEAKKEDLKAGLGQCVAEMVAAWRFNLQQQNQMDTIYGAITTGSIWRFLMLQETTVTIDLSEYALPPISPVFDRLVAMMS